MKKRFTWILVMLLLVFFCAAALAKVPDKPEKYAYAYDLDAQVLDETAISDITQYGKALEEATGIQLIAVAIDFLDGMNPADYATDLINAWGIGDRDEDNGVLILLARGDRRIQIGTGTGVDDTLTGSRCGELIDKHIDDFSNNRFSKGMVALYADTAEFLARAKGKTLAVSGENVSVSNDSDLQEQEDEAGAMLIMLGICVAIACLAGLAGKRSGCLLGMGYLMIAMSIGVLGAILVDESFGRGIKLQSVLIILLGGYVMSKLSRKSGGGDADSADSESGDCDDGDSGDWRSFESDSDDDDSDDSFYMDSDFGGGSSSGGGGGRDF